ncbi:hypothetical protein [Lysinibacillus fusiformis]|uniref:hypothetical protein n=1 Tax=Lysinibacillus fusiformis TaxID=28031 RepID=UPI00215A8789|nr:hypothetical protein [Lysinibacillus fusiformis]MCR8854529.1 hypothetical protein [Lysinibacillus fusiformis]
MKIYNSMEQERLSSPFNRKKFLQRKEAGDAYRKNAMYFQPKKNPLLLELENLLLGRTDQDLYEQQQEDTEVVTPQQQAIMEDLQQTSKNVHAHEQAYKWASGNHDGAPVVNNPDLNDTLQVLEQMRNAALSSSKPSTQDVRLAENVNAQIQHILHEVNSTDEQDQPFVNEVTTVKVPERFSKELKLDPFADTIFGKSHDATLKLRAFKQASEKYAAHVQMTKNGYRPGNDSMFSLIA